MAAAAAIVVVRSFARKRWHAWLCLDIAVTTAPGGPQLQDLVGGMLMASPASPNAVDF